MSSDDDIELPRLSDRADAPPVDPVLEDPVLEVTAEHLRRALTFRADQIEPSNESFLELRQRLDDGRRRPASRPTRSGPRLLVAAALLIVGALGAATLVRQVSESRIEAGGPTTTTASTRDEVVVDPDDTPSTTEPSVPTTVSAPDIPAQPTPVIGPRRASVEEAAQAFLDLMGVDHAGLDIDGARVAVRGLTEDRLPGEVRVWLDTVETIETDGSTTFMVTRATGGPTITSPPEGSDTVISPLVVAGVGEGFEGTVDVRLLSAIDGSALAQTWVTAGNEGQIAPYAAELEVTGAEWAWLVVTSTTGADEVLAPFSAIPISYLVGEGTVDHLVVGIEPDDSDGGLNLRAAPGNGAVVAVLEAGTSGIRRTAEMPALIDGQVWWEIHVDLLDGRSEGWVNRAFLEPEADVGSPVATVTDAELLALGQAFADAGFRRDIPALQALPWATDRELPVGWIGAMTAFAAADPQSAAFWETPHVWNLPPAFEPTTTSSILSFLELPDPKSPAVRYQLDGSLSPYTIDDDAADAAFGSARSISIQRNDDETPFRTTVLFVEAGPDGPMIVGVSAILWVP